MNAINTNFLRLLDSPNNTCVVLIMKATKSDYNNFNETIVFFAFR